MSAEPHHLALPVGFQVEHFRIEAVLGKGGFGITYLALDLQLGKRVAIKELLPDSIATRVEGLTVVPHSAGMQENWEWARERFLEEARTLATFSHPAIVGVHRLIEANGTVYMVMDYVEGESYEARLQRIGTEPDQASLMAVISPILSGLEEVHAHRLLHRDIKPENILIDKRGQPVLIDFGSARESVGKTMTMTSIVTHGYSPIEQYQTKGRMGPWTDIYAIAAVMSRAIAGEKPPVASDRVLDDSYESLVIRVSSYYSHEFCFAVDQALKVRPEDRPQSIPEWKQQLSVDPAAGTTWSEETATTESSNLKAQCPHCAQRVEIDWSMQSSLVECPTCRETFRAVGEQHEEKAHPIKPPPVTPRKKSKLPVVATAVCTGLLLLAFAVTLLRPSDPNTLREKGRKLLQGEDTAKDATKGISLLEQAADRGDVEAQLLLGKTFSKDNEGGPAQDLAVSFKWFSRAAEQQNAEAQYNLGLMYSIGLGVAEDEKVAVDWCRKAAEQGLALAQFELGVMYAGGLLGVAKDEKVAVDWYRKAAEQGLASAQFELGVMCEGGLGVAKDEKVAFDWYRKAAEQGFASAQYNLGLMYSNGRGVAKDERAAVDWCRKAAEQGLAFAQYNLGVMYADGLGVAKDEKVAFDWYRKAAEQGDAPAQYCLGLMYANGRGVAKDEKVAVKWYRKAAEQGNQAAKDWLGKIPYAKPVPGKPGFVTSPFVPQFVDVRGFPSSAEVKDPYTGRLFLVP